MAGEDAAVMRLRYTTGLAISPYRPCIRIESDDVYRAFKAGVSAARRDTWMERARENRNDGHAEAAATCIKYARENNRSMVANLRGLRSRP